MSACARRSFKIMFLHIIFVLRHCFILCLLSPAILVGTVMSQSFYLHTFIFKIKTCLMQNFVSSCYCNLKKDPYAKPRTPKPVFYFTSLEYYLMVRYMPSYCVLKSTDIDECASGPCQNDGTCIDQVNGYLCQCAPGYTDLQCQTGKGTDKLKRNASVIRFLACLAVTFASISTLVCAIFCVVVLKLVSVGISISGFSLTVRN